MFNVSKIKNSLSGLVGYKQPFNPDYAIVDADNLLSESGYYVNSNPLAKIEFIKDCQDYRSISDADFNTVLSDIVENSAINVVNQVFNESSYIDRNFIYKNALNKNETEELPNGFIGYRIKIDDTKSIGFKVTRLFADFDGIGDVKFLLFNSAKKAVILSETVTITTDHQEVELNWELNDTDTIYKGEYFIGYIKTDSFTLNSFTRKYEDANVMSYITHLDIDKVRIPDHDTETLFDLSKVEYINEDTGFNLDITVYNDYTDLIIQNRFLFARAIHLSSVITSLQIYVASLRSNDNEREADELYRKIMIEVEGVNANEGGISVKGLKPQLLTEISNIKDQILSIKEGYFGNGYQIITES